ncbi:MAG: hypothetical protein ABL921_13765 [Pirellula sp.]
MTIYGFDQTSPSFIGNVPGSSTLKQPNDDLFLMRASNNIPTEIADRPAYVALLHGNLDSYRDLTTGNEPSSEVQRINYDAGLNGRLTVLGRGGNDHFYVDDNSTITTLDGGAGFDTFQVGQIFGNKRDNTEGALLHDDVFPILIATTRGWLSPGTHAPLVATGGTGNDEFIVYSNQAELRLEGDDENDLFVVRAFALAAVSTKDWNNDSEIDADDLNAVNVDSNMDGTINAADADETPDDWTDDTIVFKQEADGRLVAVPKIGSNFSTNKPLDIRTGGGADEVQYNVNAPVSVEGGTGFDKLVILGTEFADDIVITAKGIFGAGLNVRYSTIELVEVDGLEGDDEFFVQSTEFGVAYRVIGGLGSDSINVTGDITEDIVVRELEGASGAIDHLVRSADPNYNGLPVDGIDYNVATGSQGLVVITETNGFTTMTEGGVFALSDPMTSRLSLDKYSVHLSVAPMAGTVVFVTVSAARSPEEEEQDRFDNPAPLPNGKADTMWLSTGTDLSIDDPLDDFRRHIQVNGALTHIPKRAVVLRFDSLNWDDPQFVYLFAVDDLRSEGDRVVVSQHSVISTNLAGDPTLGDARFHGVAVRNVEVAVRDNDTPGVYVTEVEPGTTVEDRRTLVIEGTAITELRDEFLVELAREPQGVDTITLRLVLDADSQQAMDLSSLDGRFSTIPDGLGGTAYLVTFDSTNWDEPIRVVVVADDDYQREDPERAVIGFSLDTSTIDADGDYVFPNLRSGTGLLDVEVIDNETAGVVALESGGVTQLVRDDLTTLLDDETVNDNYTMRLTLRPTQNVEVAVLTDGLADVLSIGGAPVVLSTIGGYQAAQKFVGSIEFLNVAGKATLTRTTGADLGSFIDEGFAIGKFIRIAGAGPGLNGDFYVHAVSDDVLTLTVSLPGAAVAVEIEDTVVISTLARQGLWEGTVNLDAGLRQIIRPGLAGTKLPGFLSDGFLEGQRVRVTNAANLAQSIDLKIALIRGDNKAKDSKLEFTAEGVLPAWWTGSLNVIVNRLAAVATFTNANWYVQQNIVLTPDSNYDVPPTREGVKVFPVSTHLLSKLAGPLAVEGGVTGADRSLKNGVKLPGESDAELFEIGLQPPEGKAIDVLNIFNDSSQQDRTGTMTATTLRGFGTAKDLSFPGIASDVFGEPTLFPGGISYGTIAFSDGQFVTDGQLSTLEVVNFLGGKGNDHLDILSTLDPAPPVTATNKFTFTSGAGGGTVSRVGFDWEASGFLVGQTISISGLAGTWTVASILDSITLGNNSILTLTGGAALPNSNVVKTITAADSSVTRTGNVTIAKLVPVDDVAPTASITRHDSVSWETGGFVVGQLVMIEGQVGSWRLVGFALSGTQMLLRGAELPNDAVVINAVRTVFVPGVHGGLTVIHGGGNMPLSINGKMQTTTSSVNRLDGLSWIEDGYAIGQQVQISGETGTRTILSFANDPGPFVKPFIGQGTGSIMMLSGGPIAVALSERTVHVSKATKESFTGSASTATSSLTRSVGSWIADGFVVGQQVWISGLAGAWTIGGLSATVMTLNGAALTPMAAQTLTVFGYDPAIDGGVRIGGDHITVSGGAGPNSPLVVYGDTSQDGVWYSGHAHDVLGYEFGDKPFDPFSGLPDEDNEDDEWVFPLADPFFYAGNDVIDASGLFAATSFGSLPSVGFIAYGGSGNDLIIGSQAGDHLAGGSGDDEIRGLRGVDHIYGDSGVNVNILTRALSIETTNSSPAPTFVPGTATFINNGTTVEPYASPVADLLTAGRDLIYGDGPGTVGGGPEAAYDDVIFGDHGTIIQNVIDPNLPNALPQKIQTTTLESLIRIESRDLQNGNDDVIFGNLGRDIIIAGAGHDMADGDEADDLVFGDNVTSLTRRGGNDGNLTDEITSLRFQTLAGTLLYGRSDQAPFPSAGNSGALLTDGIARNYRDPDGSPWWAEYLIDYAALHNYAFDQGDDGVDSFGNDYIAGSEKNDLLFGQLGDDVIQGDGGIELAFAATSHAGASRTPEANAPVGPLSVVASLAAVTDGEDYVEGGGGNDIVFGGMGQDDIVGGSSTFFSLVSPINRPDDDDILFGGDGTQIGRNNALNTDGTLPVLTTRHASDADTIAGDNANIIRIVGVIGDDLIDNVASKLYVTFNYDNYDPNQKIVVRGVTLLDYSIGGPDANPNKFGNPAFRNEFGLKAQVDIGGHDEVHGETGDDTVYLPGGNDIAYGDAEDDDIIAGWGFDWISGGTGDDGVLGDDGRIFTSRNSTSLGEPLYGVAAFQFATDQDLKNINGNALNEVIYTPGNVQTATINIAAELKKTVDLTLWNLDPDGGLEVYQNPVPIAVVPRFANDIIYGGLGIDALHGGAGDDAISGAEAILVSYTQTYEEGDTNGNGFANELNGFARSDWTRPFNTGDVLRHNVDDPTGWHRDRSRRSGEFALYDEYDPRRKIEIVIATNNPVSSPLGSAYKGALGTTAGAFLLYFNSQYGLVGIGEGIARSGGVTPDGVPYLATFDDGKDRLFGDLGNDWIVGGTGKDTSYGGFGNDLINDDDFHDTETQGVAAMSDNESPDTQPFYEDRAYGGAGRDVLIANTGGDRLIDWVGEFNTYLVPFAPFGTATVSRTLQPQLSEFLYALSKSDGADPTRRTDEGGGLDPARNGEPFGELGLLRQQDQFFHDQTGAPADPQAGNIPGGKRDVLRSATFDNNKPENLLADSGVWQVSSGVLQVSANSPHQDAVAVYQIGDRLPSYFEVASKIMTIKPTAGWNANSYIVFDYVNYQDFKFAGIDISTNKLVIGHRTSSGWITDKQTPVQLKSDLWYDVIVSINGTAVTVVSDKKSLSHTFSTRVIDGISYGLNWGLVGFGSDNARGAMDNISVNVLPPQLSIVGSDDFSTAALPMFGNFSTGSWTVSAGRYLGNSASSDYAINMIDISGVTRLPSTAALELSATLSTNSRAGVVFDRYDNGDFKWAAFDVKYDEIMIGHYTSRGGWATDKIASFAALTANVDFKLSLFIKDSSVSLSVSNLAGTSSSLTSHVFNAVAVDGGFGLLLRGGTASFDTLTVKTNVAIPSPAPTKSDPNVVKFAGIKSSDGSLDTDLGTTNQLFFSSSNGGSTSGSDSLLVFNYIDLTKILADENSQAGSKQRARAFAKDLWLREPLTPIRASLEKSSPAPVGKQERWDESLLQSGLDDQVLESIARGPRDFDELG